MVNRDLVAAKLAELNDRVQRVRTHAPQSVEELEADRDRLDLVAFNLMLSVQICADIAGQVFCTGQKRIILRYIAVEDIQIHVPLQS